MVRQAAEWVLSGWSLVNVAAEFRQRGVGGAHGGAIGPSTVRALLLSPTIAGHRVYRGQIVARGNWTPILDEQTWQAVRLRLSQPRQVARTHGDGTVLVGVGRRGSSGRRYLITGGLAVCGVCEHAMGGGTRKIRDKRVPYLSCSVSAGGRGCVGIVLETTERYVIGRLFDELDKPEFLDAIAADEHGSRRDEITRALDGLDRQRGELATMWATPGELTATEWQQARAALTDNEQRLRTELAGLSPPVIDVDIAGAREAWPDMTLDEQREFLRLFIESVKVHRAPSQGARTCDPGSRVKIKWRTR